MIYRILADLVVVVHLAFIVFAALGGLLAFWWKRVIWLHIPAAVWATLIMLIGWVCPLTPLENWLRRKGGESGYETSFVDQYIIPLIYPDALRPGAQIVLGIVVLLVNLGIYGWVLWNRVRSPFTHVN